MTIAQKQLAFLEETASHYNTNNRCAGVSGCKYSPKSLGLEGKSEGCAIGRKLSPELALELDKWGGGSVTNDCVWPRLPGELKELTEGFLEMVQHLHDAGVHWTIDGLSEAGKSCVERIKKQFGL